MNYNCSLFLSCIYLLGKYPEAGISREQRALRGFQPPLVLRWVFGLKLHKQIWTSYSKKVK